MTPLSEAHKSLSPYEQTQIFSYTNQELLSQNFQLASNLSESEQSLISKLYKTLEGIKEFYFDRFKFIGINKEGRIPPFFIHFQGNNAYYHPKTFRRPEHFAFNDQYVTTPEVVAHEFTHGVIKWLNPLGNKGEAGAINESIADIVGVLYKRHVLNQKDWTIGNLRNLKDNPKLENPTSSEDNGYVHHNSRVLSHAFYQASNLLERQGFDDQDEKLLKIWFLSVQNLEEQEKTFQGFKKKTIDIGWTEDGSPFSDRIRQAWDMVDLTIPPPRKWCWIF